MMKKILCIILAVILTSALIPTAFAEFEPAEDTPYGIPLYEKAEDVDIGTVLMGHTYRRMLDLVDNIEVKQDMLQVSQGQTISMILDDYYFLDNGQYVKYSEQTDKEHNATSYQLFLYDKDDPYYYVKHQGGRDKYEAQAEYIDMMLDMRFCGVSSYYFDFEITNAELVDGLYVCEFNAVPKADLEDGVEIPVSYSGCSVTIEPETSLLRGYTYRQERKEYGEETVSAEVNYNVDKEPDYSIKY